MQVDPLGRLECAARVAVDAVGGGEAADVDASPKPSAKPEFGDFQLNAAMPLGKKLGRPPREIAAELSAALVSPETGVGDLIEEPEIAGPGFLNLRLKPQALATALQGMDDPSLGVARDARPHGVTIDVCGVNVAKQMHVGHLRSTVIGDTVARLFERIGRDVHRQNHLGDWGLPIAMTLHSLISRGVDLEALDLDALNVAYREAQLEAKADAPGLAAVESRHCGPHRRFELEAQQASATEAQAAAREALVQLQSGDAAMVTAWRRLIEVTMDEVYRATALLNTRITPESERGESSFRDDLAEVVDAFVREGLAVEDDGALVVRFADRERPMLIRKRDGGFLYATTDLAALRYRVQDLDSDEVVYVVDARQRDHFRDVFDACRMIGWATLPDGTEARLKHLGFGTVLGPDKKPLKTRSGANFKLMDLLQAAIDRGCVAVRTRSEDPNAPTHGLDPAELEGWASPRSSTPTCPPTPVATTSSISAAWSPSKATPGRTSSTPTPASDRCWRRPPAIWIPRRPFRSTPPRNAGSSCSCFGTETRSRRPPTRSNPHDSAATSRPSRRSSAASIPPARC